MLIVYDAKAVHHIMLKDVEFVPKRLEPSKYVNLSRSSSLETECVDSGMHTLLGPGLLSTTGVEHKRQRKVLNPVFSAAHLRDMTHIFYKVAHRVRDPLFANV